MRKYFQKIPTANYGRLEVPPSILGDSEPSFQKHSTVIAISGRDAERAYLT